MSFFIALFSLLLSVGSVNHGITPMDNAGGPMTAAPITASDNGGGPFTRRPLPPMHTMDNAGGPM